MKKFTYQKQSHFTADGDHFKANNRTLADFPKPCELSPKNNRLLSFVLFRILAVQSEKEIAEPGNSFNLSKANSTPNRAFFVRNFRTPKENQTQKGSVLLSMVERNGKGSPFAVFLLKRFSSPLRSTAQILESLGGRLSKNLLSKAFTMIYKFLSIQGNKRLKITVYANSKAEALSRIQWLNKPLCIVSNLKSQGGVYA